MNRFGLLLFVLIVPTSALLAQSVPADTQTGNFLYKMPTGWNPVQKGDTTIIYAPSLPQGKVAYIALAADNLDGNLRNSFNELWGGFRNSYRILQGGETAPLKARNGYDAFYTTAAAADRNGQRWSVYVMGAQYKNRIQTVMFMSNLPPGIYALGASKSFSANISCQFELWRCAPWEHRSRSLIEDGPHKLAARSTGGHLCVV
jgi:hypothetical protein